MSAIRISLGLLIAVFAILLLYKIHKLKTQVPGYGSQEDVPVLRVDYVSIKNTLPGVW